ncbi:Gpi1-domain-containing protein [Rhizopus microsporus var. microsporus]|uniref:Gpi1-domain-containing protein n=1 Tax=Rhizopus microsporus var. microsporus TaxID=86635 RepID=A0A1X0R4H0_RHIZD|nr:Gpi1-domain-containing protein [Rhizopus microsporus var. microsporus]
MCFLFLILTLAEATLQALNLHLPPWILNGIAFKDLSAAGQQIDLRLQQLFFWSRQYVLLRKQNWANTAKARAHYISFYNSMWLVANDIIIGIALGSFLTANKYVLAERLHDILNKYTVKSLESMVSWFLESPAGLKLNQELAYFLSELFLWLLRLWTLCPQAIERFTPQIIHAIGLSARIFNWQLVILYSLFNLFRGKKKNVLRNRIDSCDYDLDQLLLGTSLFTLLTFLFPTVFVYYLTFALGRVGIIILQAIMETVLAFFNHFPLFAIMLRIKDPHRLPGGLQFHIFSLDYFAQKQHTIFYKLWISLTKKKHKPALRKTKKLPRKRATVTFNLQEFPKRSFELQRDSMRATYLWMRNLPISMSAIFFQYMLLWKRLSAHYFSAYVFKCLLYGEPIKPTPKLQYPMLPDTR